MSEPLGRVITFYSYKGGTGRSMAVANIGCLLSRVVKGKVLMIDWDLEAPGLHRYFQNDVQQYFPDAGLPQSRFETYPGIIDLFLEIQSYIDRSDLDSEDISQEEIEILFREVKLNEYVIETDIPRLHLLKAGNFDRAYSRRVNTFKWNNLFDQASWLIPAFAKRLVQEYEYVLIDSRTGFTDTSGICTMLMPECLVVVFTPNHQSLTGIFELVRKATNYRRQSDDLRPLMVFPLPSRIEMAEDELRQIWRLGDSNYRVSGYEPEFEALFKDVYGLQSCELKDYFDEIQIQHIPRYAYGEEIAVLVENSADRLSLTRAYQSFANRLLSNQGPWEIVRNTDSVDKMGFSESLNKSLAKTTGKPLIRLFLSSPSDVPEERIIVRRLIEEIAFELRDRLTLEVVSWEVPSKAPLPTILNPQEAINEHLPRPAECDIVIVIIWSRMGTPLPSEYVKPNGSLYMSGTEWEYEDALQAYSSTGKPQIIVFRRIEPISLEPDTTDLDQKVNQLKAVNMFFSSFIEPDGSIRGAYTKYSTVSEFRTIFELTVKRLVLQVVENLSTNKIAQKIFISYRRKDSAGYAGRIYDRLVSQFGRQRVFMDIDSIPPGVDFVSVLEQAIEDAQLVLLLIGDSFDYDRLQDPADFVRIEIETALKNKKPVIPLLIEGAQMPSPAQLPPTLHSLSYYNAFTIDYRNFNVSMEKLTKTLKKALDSE